MRIIDRLRKLFPGKWTYVSPRQWNHEAGWSVIPFSVLSPRYDGDDETCRIEYRRIEVKSCSNCGGTGYRGGTVEHPAFVKCEQCYGSGNKTDTNEVILL